MRIRCYKITFLKDGSLESLESLEVIIPSYNQESAKRNIERHGLRIIIQNTHYGYTYLYNSLDSKQPHLHS